MNKDQITALARKHGTSYTNRHFVDEPAFAFGHEAWAAFCGALVATAQPVEVLPCATCGADEPFTGSCGTSISDTRALCNQLKPVEAQPVQLAVSDDEILSACGDFAIDAIGKTNLIRISRQVLNFAASKASLVSATLTEGS